MLELAGIQAPDYMQGRSFLPMLSGRVPSDWRQATYYRYWMHMAHHDNPAHFGIRTKTHKLIFYYGLPAQGKENATPPGWELYDMVRDPGEMNNIYHDPAQATRITQLKNQLLSVRRQLNEEDQSDAINEVIRTHWNQ